MATIANQLGPIDVYHFNSAGNAFVRKETLIIPLPATFTDCSPGPDGMMRVYTKIVPTEVHPPREYYVGQTVEALNSLIVNA